MSGRRGFTLIETMIALALGLAVCALALKLLMGQQRLARLEAARVETQLTLHAALTYLVRELRPVGAGPDLIEMGSDAMTFRATRGFALACDVSGSALLIRVQDRYGTRMPVPGRDSMLLYWAGDSATRDDDRWLPLPIAGVGQGTGCGGVPVVILSTVWDSAGGIPGGLRFPAPLRIYEILQVRAYQSDGRTWLGARSVSAGEVIQPAFGPLADAGLRFDFLDPQGRMTLDRDRVRSIGITVSAVGTLATARDSLTTRVLLRNSPAR
ncbi:MAG TPA: type II secretion system protein [Gemmatimonadales bacterium]|nr:type II secretion system protein [Gemmatimonadales bacterium]